MSPFDPPQRTRLRVTGTVQGVGFRPFVYRLAVALGLNGSVRNDTAGVLIEVEGRPDRIAELCRRLIEEQPPRARVEHLAVTEVTEVASEAALVGFSILESAADGDPEAPVGIDTATCAACLAEVDDPADRRYRYPFTNCTNCGPRYTIVRAVPYDRAATTMAGFAMCDPCRREYDDPLDRRFHAQPNACADCGPALVYCTPSGRPLAAKGDALDAASEALRAGRIVAVKGIGGFHLAVDATDEAAVEELRRRKHRDDKAFAVMVPDLAAARSLCGLDADAERALRSARRPIVLAPRRDAGPRTIASRVAPAMPELGLLLPYTALHHLLLRAVDRPLVMTSGNVGDEPIAHTDPDVFTRLEPLTDGVLTHDRAIHVRCDDSVARSTGGRTQVLRRSRGYAPEPFSLLRPARRRVLAVGAELKSTVSVARGSDIVTSHHLGDLAHPRAFASHVQAIEHLCALLGVMPEVVAHDLHPDYLSTKWALDTALPTLGVQHHHAHVASCLVDHRRRDLVLGLAFDGLGYGHGGALWGGEFLAADLTGCERVAHLAPVALPGGAAAIREPWRMAVSWVDRALGPDAAVAEANRLDPRGRAVHDLVRSARTPVTTSMGRLFDAVAALLGLRSIVSYEGQAAIELEALARIVPRAAAPRYAAEIMGGGTLPVLDPGALIATVITERDRGTPPETVAAGFHEGLGRAAASLAVTLAGSRGLDTVALTGGVFQNARLTEVVASDLAAAGLEVLLHRQVPPNDGGISIGQAAIAASVDRVATGAVLPC